MRCTIKSDVPWKGVLRPHAGIHKCETSLVHVITRVVFSAAGDGDGPIDGPIDPWQSGKARVTDYALLLLTLRALPIVSHVCFACSLNMQQTGYDWNTTPLILPR